MSILFVMLPTIVLMQGAMLALLLWSLRSGQYEDVEGEKHRILLDEER